MHDISGRLAVFVSIRRPLIEFCPELRCEAAEAQAFDGPAPETINGRLAMLGVVTCLAAEFSTNVGIQEQTAKAPFSILGTFVIISLASYIPIFRYPLCSAFVMPVAYLQTLRSNTSISLLTVCAIWLSMCSKWQLCG